MEQTVMETMYPLEYISTHYPMENQIKSSVWSWWNNDKKLRYNKLGIRLLYNVSLQIIRGYIINQKCLLQINNNLKDLQETIVLLQEKSKHELLAGQEQEILSLLSNYAKTLTLLEQYDKEKIALVKKAKGKLTFIKGVAIR